VCVCACVCVSRRLLIDIPVGIGEIFGVIASGGVLVWENLQGFEYRR
jgi:hypothetical protein